MDATVWGKEIEAVLDEWLDMRGRKGRGMMPRGNHELLMKFVYLMRMSKKGVF